MIVSFDDSLGLLSKWSTDRASISAVLFVEDAAASFLRGFWDRSSIWTKSGSGKTSQRS